MPRSTPDTVSAGQRAAPRDAARLRPQLRLLAGIVARPWPNLRGLSELHQLDLSADTVAGWAARANATSLKACEPLPGEAATRASAGCEGLGLHKGPATLPRDRLTLNQATRACP
jgi:hypothetical protein